MHIELGLDVLEPLADGVQAEEQLPGDLGLVLDHGGRAQHLGLAGGQAKAVERIGAEGGDLLLEQQRVGSPGSRRDGEAPAVAR